MTFYTLLALVPRFSPSDQAWSDSRAAGPLSLSSIMCFGKFPSETSVPLLDGYCSRALAAAPGHQQGNVVSQKAFIKDAETIETLTKPFRS